MKKKYERLMEAMYMMFLENTDLDMDDYQVMWEALMDRWGINVPAEWETFLEKINCDASESYKFFESMFWQYFYVKPLRKV